MDVDMLKNTIFENIADGLNADGNISNGIHEEIKKLNQMVHGLRNIGKTFYDCLVSIIWESVKNTTASI